MLTTILILGPYTPNLISGYAPGTYINSFCDNIEITPNFREPCSSVPTWRPASSIMSLAQSGPQAQSFDMIHARFRRNVCVGGHDDYRRSTKPRNLHSAAATLKQLRYCNIKKLILLASPLFHWFLSIYSITTLGANIVFMQY